MTRIKTIEQLVQTRQRDIALYKLSLKASLPTIAKPPPTTDIFSPRTFEEFVGQAKAKDVCKIIIDSAKIEDRPIPNILIFGPYGLGKTTLARLIMERHGKPYRLLDANVASRVSSLKDYLIIDEIHNLPPETCDELNTLMDQGHVHLIGATTNPGSLPTAFRSRLRPIGLEDYTEDDIFEIIKNALKRKKINTSKSAITEIAKRSRLNPRHALQILAFSLELTVVTKSATLSAEVVRAALTKLDIDDLGLTSLDRRYLSVLSSMRPTGLTQICSMLGTDADTVEYEIEPFLLKLGLIERTARGRLLLEQLSDEQLEELLRHSVEIQNSRKRKVVEL